MSRKLELSDDETRYIYTMLTYIQGEEGFNTFPTHKQHLINNLIYKMSDTIQDMDEEQKQDINYADLEEKA